MRSLVLALVLLSVGLPARAQARPDLMGEVVDRESRAPLAGVRVRLLGSGREATSDEWGYFEFPDLPAGEYAVVVDHVGYRSLSEVVSITGGEQLVVEIDRDPVAVPGVEVVGLRAPASGARPTDILAPAEIATLRERSSALLDLLRQGAGPRLRISQQGSSSGGLRYCVESSRYSPSVSELMDTRGGCRPALISIDGTIVFTPPTSDLPGDTGPTTLSDIVSSQLLRLHPEEILEVEFMTPVQASFRYGEVGRFGALVVRTRGGVN